MTKIEAYRQIVETESCPTTSNYCRGCALETPRGGCECDGNGPYMEPLIKHAKIKLDFYDAVKGLLDD